MNSGILPLLVRVGRRGQTGMPDPPLPLIAQMRRARRVRRAALLSDDAGCLDRSYGLDPSSFSRAPLASKCLADAPAKPLFSRCLQTIHQIGAVMRSGEYRRGETAFSLPGVSASAQPLPHNPRKQRKNPAAAGSGERFRRGKWRRERDSTACFAPPAPLHGRTSHQSGHVTLCGVRVAFTTTSCSARVRHLSPSRSRAAATIQGSSIMRAVDR